MTPIDDYWQDDPGGGTPITAEALNTREEAIVAAAAADIAASVESRQSLTEKGDPDGYAPLDGDGLIPNVHLPPGLAVQPVVRDYTVPGPLEVSSGVLGMVMPTNYESLQVALATTSAPVGAPVIVDVNKNGTTVFSTQANRPQVNIGSVASAIATPNTTTGSAGDRLTFDVDQVDEEVAAGAPTFVSVDTTTPGAGITTYDVPRPAAAQLGDLMLVGLYSQSTTSAMWTPPASEGWNSAGASFSFSNSRVHWFWRIDDGDAGPWTFTAASSHTLSSVRRFTYRGVHQTTPIDVYGVGGSNSANATVAVPAITTVSANVRELLHIQTNGSAHTVSGLSAYTTRFGVGTAAASHAADLAHATAGLKAGFNATLSSAFAHQVTRIGIAPGSAEAFEQIAGVAVVVRYLETA